jgi:hypothetical protein
MSVNARTTLRSVSEDGNIMSVGLWAKRSLRCLKVLYRYEPIVIALRERFAETDTRTVTCLALHVLITLRPRPAWLLQAHVWTTRMKVRLLGYGTIRASLNMQFRQRISLTNPRARVIHFGAINSTGVLAQSCLTVGRRRVTMRKVCVDVCVCV